MLLAAVFTMWAATAGAEEPSGYYSTCEGKSSKALLVQLQSVVGSHTNVGYDGLYTVYNTSDVRPNGTLWDIYSTKEWKIGNKKCGNYTNIGDCYNREHSVPQSWFNSRSPMKSDAFHVYPTDGKVNGLRSNLPYGECANGDAVGSYGNIVGLGHLGACTFPGYSGKVFEPDDEYKGDLARSYFYMAAAYNSSVASWSGVSFGGNNYPVFSTWTVNLLLKWHRQDPVSQKELDRNEAIYKHQRNRNPFIDHPELAEYIWGNKVGTAWYANATLTPEFSAPVDGTTVAMGTASTGVARTVSIPVKGTNLDQSVKAATTGTCFSVTPTVLTADAVNNGTAVTVTFLSTTAVTATGTLTLTSGAASTTVNLSASAIAGLPAGPAINISTNSFTATWTCIDTPDTNYTLRVMQNGEMLPGYPRNVRAGDEKALVSGLDPESTYTYTVTSPSFTSETVSVTTAAPIPSVTIMFDGDLYFYAMPGEPSETAELLLDIENIPGDIEISVESPFEVSTDKANWATSTTVAAGSDRFYMRLNGMTTGHYSTPVTVTADDYFNDDAEVEGMISNGEATFTEDFEAIPTSATYKDHTYIGANATWQMKGIYIASGNSNHPYNGEQSARFRLKEGGCMTMTTVKQNGAGTISFWACPWGSDGEGKIQVNVSTDGTNWETAATVTIADNTVSRAQYQYVEYSADINKEGPVYLQLKQTAGDRILLDDLAVTDHRGTSTIVPDLEYHTWDAYCRNHTLIIENNNPANSFAVYSIDGTEVYTLNATTGETAVELPSGLYIVVVDDFARRVIVR